MPGDAINAASPAPPLRALPWRLTLLLVVCFGASVPSFSALTPGGGVAALCGLSIGLFGALLGTLRWATVGLGIVSIGLLVVPHVPFYAGDWFFALLLCGLTGVEATKTGGRAMVLALFAFALAELAPDAPDTAISAAIIAVVGSAMLAVAAMTGIVGRAAQVPSQWRNGLGLAIFLALILVLAANLRWFIPQAYAHWVVLMSIVRAIAPTGQGVRSALRFGLGAFVGSAIGLGFALLWPDLPDHVRILAAGTLGIAGLHLLPNPVPYAPAAFSAALLIGLAHEVDHALFRMEAVIGVTIGAALLTIAISVVFAGIARVLRPGADQDAQDTAC